MYVSADSRARTLLLHNIKQSVCFRGERPNFVIYFDGMCTLTTASQQMMWHLYMLCVRARFVLICLSAVCTLSEYMWVYVAHRLARKRERTKQTWRNYSKQLHYDMYSACFTSDHINRKQFEYEVYDQTTRKTNSKQNERRKSMSEIDG